MEGNMGNYLPTPDEIRRGCAEIQAGWSAEVEAARRYNPCRVDGRVDGWLPPGCGDDSAGVQVWPLMTTGRFLAE